MDFIKKNIGLLLFMIVCIGVVIYLVINILGAQKLRDEKKAERQKHLDLLASVKQAGLRFDEENLKLAKENANKSKERYLRFIKDLCDKQLLPGIDFSVDPDEESSSKEEDEDGGTGRPKVDIYKNLPYRKLFDEWMKGSLFDARETLTNEILKMNIIYFKVDEDLDDDEADSLISTQTTQPNAPKNQKANDEAADDKGQKKEGAQQDNVAKKADEQKNAEDEKKAAEKKAIIEEKKAEMDAGKSTYQVEKEKRMKIIKGQLVPEYFMFNEYVLNRETGLKNNKEKRNSFRQLILLDLIVRMLRKSEIKTLDKIDFPCGLEILDGDKYTFTPISITVTGKPECVEAFLNLLNANENYIFYLKDIVSFDATVQLNTDPMLAFNNAVNAGSSELDKFLKSVGTTVGTTGAGGGDRGGMDMGGDEGRGGGRRRRGRRGGGDRNPDDRGGMLERGGMPRGAMAGRGGGMDDGMPQREMEPISRTRKAYRIFADTIESNGGGDSRNGGDKRQSNSLEEGTSVTLSLNFEFVEFKYSE